MRKSDIEIMFTGLTRKLGINKCVLRFCDECHVDVKCVAHADPEKMFVCVNMFFCSRLSHVVMEQVLLHELAHIKLGEALAFESGHGPRFLRTLQNIGGWSQCRTVDEIMSASGDQRIDWKLEYDLNKKECNHSSSYSVSKLAWLKHYWK